ncbi:hypothetical protein [Saliniramus sp.]|uniref:hypothetical protein n=1 Tax=Saliniramus sp. TaxID=2986772 RepID=UPI002C9AFEB0|nr:hypothetical protein [Saliniramus sp.]HMB11674.1 hypothetical protein [Saliniramus sp.]
MSDPHIHQAAGHAHAPRARALAPSWSLMRLSALQRLAGAGLLLALVWLTLARLIGWI